MSELHIIESLVLSIPCALRIKSLYIMWISAHTTYNDTLDNCVGRQLLLPFKLEPSSILLLKFHRVRATYQEINKGATVDMELT